MGQEEWLTARQVMEIVNTLPISPIAAQELICGGANDGVILTAANKVFADSEEKNDCVLGKGFWWARGREAIDCNWLTGYFETWIDHKVHVRAYGVTFRKADILLTFAIPAWPPETVQSAVVKVGRPRADWWDDLWAEMARLLYLGDLKPTRQADLEKAMLDWLAVRGHQVSESTIRPRARKLWRAISAEGKN